MVHHHWHPMATSDEQPRFSRWPAKEVYAAYLQALSRGDAVDFEDWCRQYPGHAGELQALDELVTLARALVATPSLQDRLNRLYGEEALVTVSLREEGGPEAVARVEPSVAELKDSSRSGPTDRYSVEAEVGRGGMGVIYRVRDRQLNRTLAMKVRGGTTESPAAIREQMGLARFLEEAQVTAQLDHPGIVAVHDLGLNEEGQLYFTMKLVKGRDLGRIFDQTRRGEAGWNLARAVGVLVKACQALAYAHSKGVIHRDLKPANIMVGRFGEVVVMDWGLAKVTGQKDLHDLRPSVSSGVTYTSIKTERESAAAATPDSPLITMDGSVVGTPAYMAPEQAQGKVDELEAHSDVYSMGAILYNLLTGQPPYVEPGTRISPHTILAMVIQGRPKPVPDINPKAAPELVAICDKAMDRDKTKRYRNCFDLAEDLQAFLDHRVVRAYRTGAAAELRSWISRNRLTAAVGTAAISLLLLATLGWSEWQRKNALQAREQLARSYLRQGQAMSQAGDVHAGLHWLMQGLRKCPDQHTALAAVIRQNILAWSQQSSRLEHVFPHAEVDPINRGSSMFSAPAFAIRPNGEQLASAGGPDFTVRLWSLQTGEPVGKPMPHPAAIRGTFYADGGRTIVTVAHDAILRRWTAGGDPVGNPLELGAPIQVFDALASYDLLAVGLTNGSIRVVSVKGEPASTLVYRGPRGVTALKLGPKCERLVAGFTDGTAFILPTQGGEPISIASPATAVIRAVAFSSDGQIFATAREDGEARFWSTDDGQPVGRIMPHPASISLLRFSPDNRVLAVAPQTGSDNSIRLWSVPDGILLGEPLQHQSFVESLDFSPDGRILATGDHDSYARLWLVRGTQPLVKGIPHGGTVGQVAFTPDGHHLVISSMGQIEVWSVPAERRADATLETEADSIWATDFSPDGHRILLAGVRSVQLWSADTFRVQQKIPMRQLCWDAVFSEDGLRLLVGGNQGIAWLGTVNGEAVRSFGNSPDAYRCCTFHPDGRRVAFGSFQKQARIYSVQTGELLTVLEHPDIVEDLKFHPDGNTLLTACSDGMARLWSLSTTNLEFSPIRHENSILAVAFTPDGEAIATGSRDFTVRFWEKTTGQPTGAILQHPAWVEDLAFSSDGQLLISGCADGTVHLWNLATAEEIGPPLRHAGAVRTVAIHPDGSWILVGGEATRVTLWRRSPMSVESRAHPESRVEAITGSRLSEHGTLSRLPISEWQRAQDTVSAASTR